ncbi:MAG: hypothetical protein Q7T04_05790 [Dehalococcoidia bacterium]|nr:hypothetical protein [Dehalococcoidia bacterium]
MIRSVVTVFWASVIVFIMLLALYFAGPALGYASTVAIISLALAFFVLGILLCILAAWSAMDGALKRFLLLTGGSAAGIVVSIVLHSIVSGLFVEFWESSGRGDEPFFFIMGIIVLPIAYVVGVIGSIALMARGRLKQ